MYIMDSQLIKNKWIFGLLTMILILYGSLSQQTLPDFMYKLFDNPVFSFLMFGLIAFIGTKDLLVSFIVALIYALIMHNLSQRKITDGFLEGLRNEGFVNL
jgi:hypothetical protein